MPVSAGVNVEDIEAVGLEIGDEDEDIMGGEVKVEDIEKTSWCRVTY